MNPILRIRRWLRRWFGEPERELVWQHPDNGHEHSWGCRRCGVDPGPRQLPFRDTGSGDRDAGVDALVEP